MAGRRSPDPVEGAAAEGDCGALLSDCRCRPAVERAFCGMLTSGAPERVALDVAARVYRHHHPQVSSVQAREVVQVWVYRGCFH